MGSFSGKRVLIFGLKRSGVAAAKALARMGAVITVTDSKDEKALTREIAALPEGTKLFIGGHPDHLLSSTDMIVISPGVPSGIALLEKARQMNIPVIGELELGYRLFKEANPKIDFYAITGTNGKSTTTALLHHLLETAGRGALLGGNIGYPLAGLLDEAAQADCVVVEVSSFQLETIAEFRPKIASVLNIAPDHLDRYASVEEYAAAKTRIFENQKSVGEQRDALVLNAGDPSGAGISSMLASKKSGPEVFYFGREKKRGVYTDGSSIFADVPGFSGLFAEAGRLRIKGAHNLENAMAAACMALLADVAPSAVKEGLYSFPGLEHRMEEVARLDGVLYINDSKGTNPPATLRSLEGMASRVVLIAGGRDKHCDFAPMREAAKGKVKLAVLIGEARQKIKNVLDGAVETRFAENLAEAVEMSRGAAAPGDIVLFSPACASFDMFTDFEHRGRAFKEEVGKLCARTR